MFLIKLPDNMPGLFTVLTYVIGEARDTPTSSVDGIRLATAQSSVLVCQDLSPDKLKNLITICGKRMN
jgi:hypothetical protein